MALVAILSVRTATRHVPGELYARRQGELIFAGQTLVEYQARLAHAAGAAQIAILVDDVSPVLTGAVDRLGQDGIHVSLVRDMPSLGRMISLADGILLIGDGHVLPSRDITRLAQGAGSGLLVLPSGPSTGAFERIDAGQAWAGAARAPAPLLLGLLDMLGDWDVVLTLVRRLVQDGADRDLCDMSEVFDGQIGVITDQATADAATQALTRAGQGMDRPDGDLDDWPVGRPAGLLTPLVVRRGIPGTTLRTGAIALSLFGIALIWADWVTSGLILCLAALIGDRLARQLDRILRFAPGTQPIEYATRAAVLAAILEVGLLHGGGGALAGAGALLSVGLLALIPLARSRGLGRDVPGLFKFAPGAALLVLIAGTVLGATGQASALCALLAFASLAWLVVHTGQNGIIHKTAAV
jgi:hypothetical protein